MSLSLCLGAQPLILKNIMIYSGLQRIDPEEALDKEPQRQSFVNYS